MRRHYSLLPFQLRDQAVLRVRSIFVDWLFFQSALTELRFSSRPRIARFAKPIEQ